jgi:thioredoxin reductase (NADPH)
MTTAEPIELETRQTRSHQTYPVLDAADAARMRRFGEVRHYPRGSCLFRAGDPGPGM